MAALILTLRRSLQAAAAIGAVVIGAEETWSQVTQPLGTSRTETRTTTTREKEVSLDLGWELADTDEGVRVEKIEENSPAAKSHIEEGDIIVKIGEENIRTAERVIAVVDGADRDDDLEIVVRRDGEELSYILPLKEVNVVERTETTRSEQNVTELLLQIQQQLQQQQATLNALLAEIRGQRGNSVDVDAEIETEPRDYTGDVVAPLGVGVPNQEGAINRNNRGNRTPQNDNTPGSPAPR